MASGKADMVALARGMLYDPRWGWHAAAELGGHVTRAAAILAPQPIDAEGAVRDHDVRGAGEGDHLILRSAPLARVSKDGRPPSSFETHRFRDAPQDEGYRHRLKFQTAKHRHCEERSDEAIQLVLQQSKCGLLAALAMTSEYDFAFSPHVLREFCWKRPVPLNRGRRECRARDAPAAWWAEKGRSAHQ